LGCYITKVNGKNYGLPCYWKNGVEVKLNTTNVTGYPVAIGNIGNDIYILSNEASAINLAQYKSDAVIYKNGIAQAFATIDQGSVKAMKILGSDIYICADGFDGTNHSGIFWKNGTPTLIPAPPNRPLYVNDIEVLNGSAQVVGLTTDSVETDAQPYLFTNGISTKLSNDEANALKIINRNNKACIGGYVYSTASNKQIVVWENGITTTLPNLPNSDGYSLIIDMDASADGSLYVLGLNRLKNGIQRNVLYKDGSIYQIIGDTTAGKSQEVKAITTF
jgi:hypothetical protein